MKKIFAHKRLWLLLPVLLLAQLAFAQVRITGRVTDQADGTPLIGVTIREKGGTAGTITDFDGNYVVNATNAEAILVFVYTGYSKAEIPIGGRSQVDVTLGQDATMLEQVVVVGYGTQRKSDLTGSVGTIKAKEIEKVPTASIEQALQGKIAGVYVTPASDFTL
jgi:TonB-dependent starch-binding outer membrane protein SusC